MGWIFAGFLTVIFAEMLIRIGKGYEPDKQPPKMQIRIAKGHKPLQEPTRRIMW